VACDLEQIEGYDVKLSRRRDIAPECGSAHRRKVLDGSAVLAAERDQLSVEHGPLGYLGERREKRAEPIAQARATARPGADACMVADLHEQPEPVPLGLHDPVALRRTCRGGSAEHWLGDRHSRSVEP